MVIRKIDPWTVLKFSLIFYACLFLIGFVAFVILYGVLAATGVFGSAQKLFAEMSLKLDFPKARIFGGLALFGIFSVFVWSAVNVLVAFLYNLVADVVGGIEVSVAEQDRLG